MRTFLAVVFAVCPGLAFAQETEEKKKQQADQTMVITASPLKPDDPWVAPYSIDLLKVNDLEEHQVRSLPDALKEMPGISVQKTSAGHGSPFIRGFTGFRNVFLIDGIRLNHSGFREGPNQYWNTVDPFTIGSLEVLRGPASSLYGSDAIGGTVYVHTRTIERFPDSWELGGRALARYSSAEQSYVERLEFDAVGPDFGFMSGVSVRDFNDVIGGRHTGEQPNTGYDEYDADARFVFDLGPNQTLTAAVQSVRQDDVPRTHRTIYAKEWHGTVAGADQRLDFDQERDLAYLQYRASELNGFVDSVHASLSLHRHYEDINRLTGGGAKEYREFEILVPGVFLHGGKQTGWGYLTGGFDFTSDRVESDGFNRSAAGVRTDFERGEIAGDAQVDLAGVFLQDEFSLGSFDVVLGARWTWERIDAKDVDPSGLGGPNLEDFTETYSALAGTARFLWHSSDDLKFFGGVSQGFRAPNLDDTTAVRLVLSGQTDFPNPDVDPETSVNFELGTRARVGEFRGQLVGFYTVLDEFIARVPAPSISPTAFTKENFSDGWVKGVEASGSYQITDAWSVHADVTWSIGNLDALVGTETKERPMSKMNPATAHGAVRWQGVPKGPWIEGLVMAVRQQHRLSPSDEVDTQRIPPGGTPGYTVVSVRGGIPIHEKVMLTMAVENLADRDYRFHGSGTNEPGTNFIATLDVRF